MEAESKNPSINQPLKEVKSVWFTRKIDEIEKEDHFMGMSRAMRAKDEKTLFYEEKET